MVHIQHGCARREGVLCCSNNAVLVSRQLPVRGMCSATQAANLLDQACSDTDNRGGVGFSLLPSGGRAGTGASAALASAAGGVGDAAAKQQQLVRRASKALLKQVEETRRKYTAEVEGLKAELHLLGKQLAKDRRDADLASVTAAAAKKAALEATEELERVNDDLLRARRAVQQLHRWACVFWRGACFCGVCGVASRIELLVG